MTEEKEYIFKGRNIAFNIVSSSVLLVFSGIFCYALFNGPFVLSRVAALLLIVMFFACVIYIQYYVVRVTQQFTKYDERKSVVVNADRSQLTLFQHDNAVTIANEEVERIESYQQKYLGTFGYYNYIVIYTIDKRQILLTNFTLPLLLGDRILEKFLTKKPRTYFKKRFNYIDETKFSAASVS